MKCLTIFFFFFVIIKQESLSIADIGTGQKMQNIDKIDSIKKKIPQGQKRIARWEFGGEKKSTREN